MTNMAYKRRSWSACWVALLCVLGSVGFVVTTTSVASAQPTCKPPKKRYKGKCRYQDEIDKLKAQKRKKRGARGGKCYGNGTCNKGLACSKGKCRRPNAGSLQGKCYGNGTCNQGLVCHQKVCIKGGRALGEACPAAHLCGPGLICRDKVCQKRVLRRGSKCSPTLGICDAGLTCSRGTCRRLGVGVNQRCGPRRGKCGSGLACRSGRCTRVTLGLHQPCGPALGRCGTRMMCGTWRGRRICRHYREGRQGYRCDPSGGCNAGLQCKSARCQRIILRPGPLTTRRFGSMGITLRIPANWKETSRAASRVQFRGHKGRVYMLQIRRLSKRYDIAKIQATTESAARAQRARILYNAPFTYRGRDAFYFSMNYRRQRVSSYYVNSATATYLLMFIVDRYSADERLFGRIFKSAVVQ